jgi:hypothetical protein
MKPRIYLFLCTLLLCAHEAFPQETGFAQDFIRRFNEERRQLVNRFDTYTDSVNMEFAGYLARSWESFKTEAPNAIPRTPSPAEIPVYIPGSDERPPVDTPVTAEPATEDTALTEPPAGERKDLIQIAPRQESSSAPPIGFFGTPVRINPFEGYAAGLSGTDESRIAACWEKLAKNSGSKAFVNALNAQAGALRLGQWGIYCLLREWADANFSPGRENEKAVFIVYMLNQAGYKAKIGRMNGSLAVMAAFANTVYGLSYIRIGGDCYYILSGTAPAEGGQPVSSYRLGYAPAVRSIDLRVRTLPALPDSVCTRERTVSGTACAFRCNGNLANYFGTFPQTELQIYAATPLSDVAAGSIAAGLEPGLRDKTPAEKLAFLLSFVQHGFPYRTDREQFGREKFFFPEETLFFPYSDCEDRAALFCRLVDMFCHLDTLLIEYPSHVASAVRLDLPGDAVVYNGERYIVCDPTYIGAPIARTMKGCDNAAAKIIPLKF